MGIPMRKLWELLVSASLLLCFTGDSSACGRRWSHCCQRPVIVQQTDCRAGATVAPASTSLAVPSTDSPTATMIWRHSVRIPNLPKPAPEYHTFRGCPPQGNGGDPDLNRLKNRVNEAGTWYPMPFSSVLSLTWPKATARKHRVRWSSEDTAAVARYEGSPISVEGYLFDAKVSGPESCNCKSEDQDRRDFHVWLTRTKGEDRTRSIVVEPTPPVRARHPAWQLTTLRAIARNQEHVRISGWLMLDPEHPDQIGKTRGTIWEIHPVMRIEVERGGGWVRLDDTNWRAFAFDPVLEQDVESDMEEAEAMAGEDEF
jgi:hypothetical protein